MAVHPEQRNVWYWMIPLAGGRASVGCVAEGDFLDVPEAERESRLRALIRQEPTLGAWFGDAPFLMPVRQIGGYAANVARLLWAGLRVARQCGRVSGPGILVRGDDRIAISASRCARCSCGNCPAAAVDWQVEYDNALRKGIDVFRAFVERWYSGELQDILFHAEQAPQIRRMISAVLAGYAWDETNPFVKDAGRRLDTLHEICKATR